MGAARMRKRGEGHASKGFGHAAELREHETAGLYDSLDALCEGLDADRQDIVDRLGDIGYHYDAERNQFL